MGGQWEESGRREGGEWKGGGRKGDANFHLLLVLDDTVSKPGL